MQKPEVKVGQSGQRLCHYDAVAALKPNVGAPLRTALKVAKQPLKSAWLGNSFIEQLVDTLQLLQLAREGTAQSVTPNRVDPVWKVGQGVTGVGQEDHGIWACFFNQVIP